MLPTSIGAYEYIKNIEQGDVPFAYLSISTGLQQTSVEKLQILQNKIRDCFQKNQPTITWIAYMQQLYTQLDHEYHTPTTPLHRISNMCSLLDINRFSQLIPLLEFTMSSFTSVHDFQTKVRDFEIKQLAKLVTTPTTSMSAEILSNKDKNPYKSSKPNPKHQHKCTYCPFYHPTDECRFLIEAKKISKHNHQPVLPFKRKPIESAHTADIILPEIEPDFDNNDHEIPITEYFRTN
jgi:hypothetical protein